MKAPVTFPLTVYYDAACPLCASEMHTLRDRAPSGSFVLVDCSAPEFDDALLAGDGITRPMLLERIHARDAAGRWWRGLDVFDAVYGAAGLERPARVFGNPRLRPLLDRVYGWIADHRYFLSRLGLQRLFALVSRPSGVDARRVSSCAPCAAARERRESAPVDR